MSGRWFRPNFHVESFLRSIVQESHILQKVAIQRKFPWVGVNFVQTFMSRFCLDLEYKRATSITEVSYLETIFFSGRWFRSNFHIESFLGLKYKRATSITELSYLETIFISGRCFRPNFHVESFLRSRVQKRHINHRCEQSGDHFHEWAMISSKFSWREFLEIYSTKEPHQSQKWAIWRSFSWVGVDFVQTFMSRVS